MKRALLVIDVQNEYFTGKLPVSYPSGSFESILKAMDAASEKGIPVIVIQHTAKAADSPVVAPKCLSFQIRTNHQQCDTVCKE